MSTLQTVIRFILVRGTLRFALPVGVVAEAIPCLAGDAPWPAGWWLVFHVAIWLACGVFVGRSEFRRQQSQPTASMPGAAATR
jgi:hypothetical protein